MQLARRKFAPGKSARTILNQVEAVYLKRNFTHRKLMDSGYKFNIVVNELIRGALIQYRNNGSKISHAEMKALFGGQKQEWIDWLAEQLVSGKDISSALAAQWLAKCV
jgi:hypothetical protein